MDNAQQILVYSALIAVFLMAMTVFGRTIFAYGTVAANRKSNYRLDKTRTPLCVGVIACITILSFTYGFLVSRDFMQALQFCLLVSFFGAITSFISICYVHIDE